MKILLYSRDFSPSVGGVQTIVADLARGLTEPPESGNGEAVDLTVVTETPSSGHGDHSFSFPVIRRPNMSTLARLIRKADVIHLAGPAMAPLIIALLLRKPVVVEHHGFQAICPNGQMFHEPTEGTCPGHFMARHFAECIRCNRCKSGWARSLRMLLLTPLRRWLCNRARVNIIPTHWVASQLKLSRQRVVLHGIQTHKLASEAKSGTGPASSTLVYQGRLVSTKGIRILLDALEILCNEGRSPELVIIGAGPEEESVRAATARFGEKVRFAGEVSEGCLERILADSAIVVMPSIAGEVFGLVAAENMRRGKLLIVSDLGSLREVVGDAGLVFRTGDAAALADCMRIAMDDPSRVASLSRAAQARAEGLFDRRRMIREHLFVYREVLG